MVEKREVLRALRSERRRTLALLAALLPEEYEARALPGWRVREVVAHLIATDRAAVTGTILPVLFTSIERLERWNEGQISRWRRRSNGDLMVALDRWGRRLLRLARVLPRPLYRVPIPTAWGRGPAGMMLFVRAYDEWVHRQDIRRALGRREEEVDLAPAAEFLLRAIAQDTVPRLRGERGRVVLSLTGVPVPEWSYDLGSGAAGPGAGGPHDEGPGGGASAPGARIEAPAPAFIMAAAGRDAFEDLEARGVLRLEGDAELGRRFLEVLRIV